MVQKRRASTKIGLLSHNPKNYFFFQKLYGRLLPISLGLGGWQNELVDKMIVNTAKVTMNLAMMSIEEPHWRRCLGTPTGAVVGAKLPPLLPKHQQVNIVFLVFTLSTISINLNKN